MNILVTGGAGFIGSHLAEHLSTQGHGVHVVDDFSNGLKSNLSAAVPLLECSVLDTSFVERALQEWKIECVIHLAAQANVRRSILSPTFDARQNILGSLSVLEACKNQKVRRIIIASSGGAVYGEPTVVPIDELSTTAPISPYGVSKLCVEGFATCYQRRHSLEVVILRLGNVYGPRQRESGECGIVAIVAARTIRGEPVDLIGDGSQTRDYIHVRDVVGAIGVCLKGPQGVFNVGTGVETSVSDVIRTVERCLIDRPVICNVRPAIAGEVHRNVLNVIKVRREYGWKAEITLLNGIRETVDWYKESSPVGKVTRVAQDQC